SNACQSCAMPLKKDSQGGGSNADGSKSEQLFLGQIID
ncbi:MAG: zinc ribbon domain-containing protein, partial [Gammaproteobacteria bacterium]|nr:zinc ribbon domain-containing protein [Gammaproteobacteria bacterium]